MVLFLAQVLCSLAKPDPRSYKKEELDFARLAIANGIVFMDKNVIIELVLDLSLFASSLCTSILGLTTSVEASLAQGGPHVWYSS